jgi:sugar diacid utilization regulator/transcriptional regulator with XRE-family HTH domain
VKAYEEIRYLYKVEKLSQRAIAKKLGVSRNTVRRYCKEENEPVEVKTRKCTSPVTGPVRDKVKKWLAEGQIDSKKRYLTAESIYERLVGEGFTGAPSTIRKLVHELRSVGKQSLDKLYDEFLEIVTSGKSYQGIADLLAEKLQVRILIEDEFFRVLARAHFDKSASKPASLRVQKKDGKKYWKPQHVDPRITNYVRLSQRTARPVELPELPEYGINESRQVFPILINQKIKGHLHIFRKDLDPYQMGIAKAALHSLTVLEACRKVQLDLGDRIRRSLILGLIAKDSDKDNFIHEEKQILGFDLSREVVLAIIQIKNALGARQMEEVLSSIISDLEINACVTALNDGQAVILLQSNNGKTLEPAVIEESLQAIYDAMKMIFTDRRVNIGVGRHCFKPREYRVAFSEAQKALSFTESGPDREEGVHYYHSLGLMGLLQQPGNEQMLPLFARKKLGKLYDYSRKHNAVLIESLGCYLDNNCCTYSAARELFIHPNTMRYRLKKAESIGGLDLTDTDTRLELQLAIKLYRYYGDALFEN